jgi:mRNA deadenylase 3'-5' endonuclease subunit Ccr4
MNKNDLSFYHEKMFKQKSELMKKEYLIDKDRQETLQLYWINFLLGVNNEETGDTFVPTKALQYLEIDFYPRFIPFKKY